MKVFIIIMSEIKQKGDSQNIGVRIRDRNIRFFGKFGVFFSFNSRFQTRLFALLSTKIYPKLCLVSCVIMQEFLRREKIS